MFIVKQNNKFLNQKYNIFDELSIFDWADSFVSCDDSKTNEAPKSYTKIPFYDVIETDDELLINMSLAGVKKENVSIETEKDVMTVKAERIENKEVAKYNHKEIYYGQYEKKFNLPEYVDSKNITATMEDGILKIQVPKQKEKIPSKFTVSIK